jgi:hypothetical protein
MAAAKTEVLISQLADQLGTRFQSTAKPMFSGFPNSMQPNAILYDCTGSGKLNMAAAKTEVERSR